MKRIHGDPKRAGRRLNLIAFLCGSFWFLLFLLGLLASFFSGVAELNGASLPNVFLLAGHISRFLRKKDAIDPKEALNPLEFPLLYELAREAAGPQCKDPIYIYMGPSDGEEAAGASVLQEGGAVHIALGPVLLGILSRQELLQILRHEFAHVGLNHSREHGRFNRLIGFLSPGGG
ncbi:MAG: M48 family metalloprotease, partial [Oscillospiraceae bacterium]|nr:M48 family metalloprotease [Oscillospiraceae bacterium]